MKKKFLLFLCLILAFVSISVEAQHKATPAQYEVDNSYRRIGFHTGNRVGISFYNDGQIAGYNIGTDIRGEWPLGSGENYIGDCIPLIAVEFTDLNDSTRHSVTISRGPRKDQGEEKDPNTEIFRGFGPLRGYINPDAESVAMSHLPDSWPINGWADPGGFPEVRNYVDDQGNTEWWGYFGRGIINADQESFFVASDQTDNEFNAVDGNGNATLFLPDSTNPQRHGMGLQLRQRGFQWASFLAEDVVFWLYDIQNHGTYNFKKANFGTIVGTLAGGDGDSGDDLGFFDSSDWITYSWDNDGRGNQGQKVGYVGYAFLESPGNSFDGIDNDDDSQDESSPRFVQSDFDEVIYNEGDRVVLTDPASYQRSYFTITSDTSYVQSMGVEFKLYPGVTLREGWSERVRGLFVPDTTAGDGIDNDLDGLIDENQAIHYEARVEQGKNPLKYNDYFTHLTPVDLLIDEKRDNDIDEDGDWTAEYDDVGQDGLGPLDDNYPGPDAGEDNGQPDQGEPNFGRTDPDESDQIGLTSFNFFENASSPSMNNDEDLWSRMLPGRFDIVPSQPQDGDFIYASGYFPLPAANEDLDISGVERFSVALLFGEDYNDVVSNKEIVQLIYNQGYKFPQPPEKPTMSLAQQDGNVLVYWDGTASENSRDFITKTKDFEGYKIYRATDSGFQDARQITNGRGVLTFDNPIAQFDKDDEHEGFFYPSRDLLSQVGGTTYYLGENTGIQNSYVDSNVTPGITYYYAVVAYDHGEDSLDIFPSENSKYIFRTSTGEIEIDRNTGFITPGVRPAGYVAPEGVDFVKNDTYRGTGIIQMDVFDDSAVRDGYSYKVVFDDTTAQRLTKDWSLVDLQRPDTVYISTINETYIVNPNESITLPANTDTVFVNGRKYGVNGTTYTAPEDTLISHSDIFGRKSQVVDGITLTIHNDSQIAFLADSSKFSGVDTTTFKPISVSCIVSSLGRRYPANYQVEFYDSIVDTSREFRTSVFDVKPSVPVRFKVKNLTDNKYIDFAYEKKDNLQSTNHSFWFFDSSNGESFHTWFFTITMGTVGEDLPTDGNYTVYTKKPFSSYDELTFSLQEAEISNELAQSEMDMIKVVPNPYIVTHAGEASLLSNQTSGRGEREIKFTHVPPGSKISIFTVRGDLIRELTQDNLFVGDVYWNLRTYENIDVAFGVYVYVVEIPNVGKKIGKLALIK